MKPMISIAAMAGLLEAITAAGKNLDQILHALGLDRSVLKILTDSSPVRFSLSYSKKQDGQTGDDCFGLHFGERFNPKNIGPLVDVVINSPTILTGIENASRYLKVHNQAASTSFRYRR